MTLIKALKTSSLAIARMEPRLAVPVVISSCTGMLLARFLSIVLTFGVAPNGFASNMCEADHYHLTNQAEVDELGNSGCDTISGDLLIGPSDDIVTLNSLHLLREIKGSLRVFNNKNLENVWGVGHVFSIGGDTEVSSNPALVGGFAESPREMGSLTIQDNPGLRDLRGLAETTFRQGPSVVVKIIDNPYLAECWPLSDQLNGPDAIPGDRVSIHGNSAPCDSYLQIKSQGALPPGIVWGDKIYANSKIGELVGEENIFFANAHGVRVGGENLILVQGAGEEGLTSRVTPVVSFYRFTEFGTLIDVTEEINPDRIATWGARDTFIADFTGDGLEDIYLSVHGSEAPPYPVPGDRNILLIQSAGGFFYEEAGRIPDRNEFSHGSTYGDIDADGDLDLYINNPRDSYLLINDGSGYFTEVKHYPRPNTYFAESAGECFEGFSLLADADGDADLDLMGWGFTCVRPQGGYLENINGVLHAKSVRDFDSVYYSPANGLHEVRSLDFNQDGLTDVALLGYSETGHMAFHLFKNDGPDGFTDVASSVLNFDLFRQYQTLGGWDIDIVDINNDGLLDIEIRCWSDTWFPWRITWFGSGVGEFHRPMTNASKSPVPRGRYIDVNGDGLLDLVNGDDKRVQVRLAALPVLERPEAPVIKRLDQFGEELSVYIDFPPLGFGGDPNITFYVTCGGETVTTTSKVATFETFGMEGSIACSVEAANQAGRSNPSEQAEIIIEESLPTGLPLWLLYEASKKS